MGGKNSKPPPLPTIYNTSLPQNYSSFDYNCRHDKATSVNIDDLVALWQFFTDKDKVPVLPSAPGECSVLAQSDIHKTGKPGQILVCGVESADPNEYVTAFQFQNKTGEFAQKCNYQMFNQTGGTYGVGPTHNLDTNQPEGNKLFLLIELEDKKRREEANKPPKPPPPPKDPPPKNNSSGGNPANSPDGNSSDGPQNTSQQKPPPQQQPVDTWDPPKLRGDGNDDENPHPPFNNKNVARKKRKRELKGRKVEKRFAG